MAEKIEFSKAPVCPHCAAVLDGLSSFEDKKASSDISMVTICFCCLNVCELIMDRDGFFLMKPFPNWEEKVDEDQILMIKNFIDESKKQN